MDPVPAAVAVVAVMLFAVGGIYVLDASAQDSRHQIAVTNTSFTPDGGNISSTEYSNLSRAEYDESVTVRGEDKSVIDQTGNYTWHTSNGTLRTTPNSTLANQSVGYLSLNYTGQTPKQTAVTNISFDAQEVIAPLVLVGGLGLTAAVLFFLGRMAG